MARLVTIWALAYCVCSLTAEEPKLKSVLGGGHTDQVRAVHFTSDGKKLVSAGSGADKTVRLWDLGNGDNKVLATFDEPISNIAVSPLDTYVAVPQGAKSGTGPRIVITDMLTGNLVTSLSDPDIKTGESFAASFSPDGKRFVGAITSSNLQIWEVNNWKSTISLKGHTSMVMVVRFSPDGKLIASGAINSDDPIRLWDAASGKHIRSFVGHMNQVLSLSFSPDGKRLASASADFTARIWNVSDGKVEHTLSTHGNAVYSVAFSPDGTRVVTGGQDTYARLWDVATGKQVAAIKHTSTVTAIDFRPDGKIFAAGTLDKAIRFWEIK